MRSIASSAGFSIRAQFTMTVSVAIDL